MPFLSAKSIHLASVGILLFVLQASPLAASMTTDQLNVALLKARDAAKKTLAEGVASTKDKTEKEFEQLKAKLAATWKADIEKAVAAATKVLDAQRQAIADALLGDAERHERVAAAFKKEFDARGKALTKAVETFNAAAAAFDDTDASLDKAKSVEKFSELAKPVEAELGDDKWGAIVSAAQAAHATPTASQETQEAMKSLQSFLDRIEKGFERTVHCDFTPLTKTLVCSGGLALNAPEIAAIEIKGLPTDKPMIVSAFSARDGAAEKDGSSVAEEDSVTLSAHSADRVLVNVYLYRRSNPAYGKTLEETGKTERTPSGRVAKTQAAATALRSARTQASAYGNQLYLIVSSRAPQIVVQVKIGEGEEALVTSALVEVGYSRWTAEAGGFFAVSHVADHELLTVPDATAGNVKVIKRNVESSTSQDTGLFLNLVPRNYPWIAAGVGFSTSANRPLSFYLGPSIRLMSFRGKGIASFSLGGTLRSVKRFPGVALDKSYSASDPLLKGKDQHKFGPYALIQLGFRFGPIPGAD